MPLSWNEIKSRALQFSNEWADESSESAEAKTFWNEFFDVFGVRRRRLANYEHNVKKFDNKDGFIDLFWKGMLLVEHKSRGKNLDSAYSQALDYFDGLTEKEEPRYIVVSDFARFRLYDLDADVEYEFLLEDLHKNINLFGFIAGYQPQVIKEQDPVNIKAAESMGKLHDQMKEVGYTGHALEVYLVRLLFCLFAEDTGIFELQQFQNYIKDRTSEDGSDLPGHLSTLFQVLNTPQEQRLKNRDVQLAAFPYVNGKLFAETLPAAGFDSAMRKLLLDCCELDWSIISPAIFGSLFQSIMDTKARRHLGAHYTSEKNILKLINPLFMDDLRAEFEKIKHNKKKLLEFHSRLRSLTFFDPACGCGNFLVIAYRELRLLELEVLRVANKGGQLSLDIHQLIQLDVDQFYGIEIEDFSAQIAQVALWLMDHQMNLLVSQEFGMYFSRIPLITSAHIVHGNALRMDWDDVIQAEELSYIIGNPPFGGKSYQTKEQKSETLSFFNGIKGAGNLDYVTCWYAKAAISMNLNSEIKTAFVSTNSITQGEQVSALWKKLFSHGVKIFFAHRTFEWSSEARGKAAVHCVIIGFGLTEVKHKRLFGYKDIKGEPLELKANKINPYLVDAEDKVIGNRKTSICDVTPMLYGSKPADGGHLLLDENERSELVAVEPGADKWIKPFLNAVEFLHNKPRYCLWLVDIPPRELKSLKHVMERVEQVKNFRSASTKAATQKLASVPTLFAEIRQSSNRYLLVPAHSSENRAYIPIGYMSPEVICGNANFQIPNASLYDFGVLTSTMHMSWMRTVCGRLTSRYRYSAGIVFNNFPWPLNPSDQKRKAIEEKAQAVLNVRDQFPDSTLADLYDPLTTPPTLSKAHQALDKAVDGAYGRKVFKTEAERVAFLFELYKQYTSLL
jgi:hypothetical protein